MGEKKKKKERMKLQSDARYTEIREISICSGCCGCILCTRIDSKVKWIKQKLGGMYNGEGKKKIKIKREKKMKQ